MLVEAPKKALREHVHDPDRPQPTDPHELHTSERAVDSSRITPPLMFAAAVCSISILIEKLSSRCYYYLFVENGASRRIVRESSLSIKQVQSRRLNSKRIGTFKVTRVQFWREKTKYGHAPTRTPPSLSLSKAGIIFGPGNSPIALFQKESALFSANSFLLYPVHSIPTKSQFSPDRVMGG